MISRSNFIHLSRWFAAMLVLISHLRSLIFKNYNQLLVNKGRGIQLFYFLTSLGHQAVVVFFVLSGYLIIGSVLKQHKKGHFQFKGYLINRISRLYAVLVVALLVTMLFDYIGFRFDTTGIYSNRFHFAAENFSVQDRTGIRFFLASLFMMQGIICPPLGSNGPLWSLNFEFFYYLLFPCLCIPVLNLLKKKINFPVLIYLLTGIALIVLLPKQITIYFSLWLLGVIPIFLTIRYKLAMYILPVILLAVIFYGQSHRSEEYLFYYDFITGLIFCLWLCCFKDFKYESIFYKANEKLASFSYTLYLVHFPFIMLGLTLFNHYFSSGIAMIPSVASFGLFLGGGISAYAFSYIIASFTEFKTLTLKRFLERQFNFSVIQKTSIS